ncbi:MAG: hypothetical protein LBC21_03155, partial [Oscillospiraceae bacterium]|nr:hypothetical protein [Oscillospiraceae bacterium]
MDKWSKIALAACFLAAVFAVPALLFAYGRHGDGIAFYENRPKAASPALTADGLLDGSYFGGWESWLSDRVAGRERLLRYGALLDYAILRRPVVNGTVAAEGVLLPFHGYHEHDAGAAEGDITAAAGGLGRLAYLAEGIGARFYYVGVPEQGSFYAGDYPGYLESDASYVAAARAAMSAQLTARGIGYIDMSAVFTGGTQPAPYAATDHHYNYFGAYGTYRQIMSRLSADGLEVPVIGPEDIDITALPNSFVGSHNRRLCMLFKNPDPLYIGTLRSAVPFTREDNGGSSPPVVYALPADSATPVTYNVYMGGDVAETIIRTDRPELPNLL